eukprot:TRINITY_DN156_c0_g1_i1.p1 TRINITY_DN156_c0_g1~~TRINITY_DN156_c0_g1_i1.p1  ORF type:complete len:308 (-),score=81.01 TRINITY_DN156_c0_g1_i1:302-1225(-)
MRVSLVALLLVAIAGASGKTLKDVAYSRYYCSTSILNPLTQDIIDCMSTEVGVRFTCLTTDYIRPSSSAAIPCFQESMSRALKQACNYKNDYMTINSGLRSPAQQLMLLIHYEQRICGQTNIVAKPGSSNHNGGNAVDVKSWSYWKSTLERYGFSWYGPGDTVHFTYRYGDRSAASKMLKAFQILYNKNVPSYKRLTVDGAYGPATRAALEESPIDGFPNKCAAYRAEEASGDTAPSWRTPVIAASAASVALIAGIVLGVVVVSRKRAAAHKSASSRAEMQSFENLKANLAENDTAAEANTSDATAV